jgi:PKD repeat protein
VAAGGNLQQALDDARPGDTILLEEGAEFVGNFVLPAKTGTEWITLRTAAPDTVLPHAGERIAPSDAQRLARLRSPSGDPALRTAPGAHHWHVEYLEFAASYQGNGDIIQIGDGTSAQDTLGEVPHDIVLSHLYVHGDPAFGQKRGIALNGASVTVRDSYIAECKGVGQDTQAIAGWNGPGPFTIENNYLEAAGENVMFGGADPAIADLVPGDITFRRNYLSRPMAWRNPILATPEGVAASSEPGGSLPDGVYAYRVVAQGIARGSLTPIVTIRSTASTEVSAAASGGASAIRVRWTAVPGATEYRVYGRTAGAQSLYWTATGTEFVDTGASGTAEPVPTSAGTVWGVKNVFELKNARNVLIEENIFENHWKESQPGFAIVLTPRNSNGSCTWCVVEHVRFEYNLVRNVAAGVNLVGYDSPSRPTRQTNDIAFRHNVFTAMSTSLGGNARFMQIGDGPRDVVVEHNTIDADGAGVIYVYGGTSTDPLEVYGFEMTANAARHGSYGVHGAYFAYGNDILAHYYPGAVFAQNYLAGAPASRYPAGTLVTGTFTDQFVDATAGNYTVREGSVLKGAGPGGADIGADFAALAARLDGVDTGAGDGATPNSPPAASFTAACVDLTCTFSDGSSDGDGRIASWSWSFGAAGSSTEANPAITFAAPGTYAVVLTVTDDDGALASASREIDVTAVLHAGVAGATTKKWTSASGYTTYWSAALTLTAHGADERPVAGATVTAAWSGAVTKTVTCVTDATGRCTLQSGTLSYLRTWVTLTVTGVSAPLSTYDAAANHTQTGTGSSVTLSRPADVPNSPPAAAFTAACADLTCTFSDGSADGDGRIVSWSWSFGAAGSSTDANPTITFAAPGTYTVVLTVTDDDGAVASASRAIDVTAVLHADVVSATTKKWTSASGYTTYWSAAVTLIAHGGDERPVPGATIAAAWSGAVTKSVTCVTDATGRCTLQSGTLSYLREWVALTVTGVSAPLSTYEAAANHDQAGTGSSVTLSRP